jgi:hypothetical protein
MLAVKHSFGRRRLPDGRPSNPKGRTHHLDWQLPRGAVARTACVALRPDQDGADRLDKRSGSRPWPEGYHRQPRESWADRYRHEPGFGRRGRFSEATCRFPSTANPKTSPPWWRSWPEQPVASSLPTSCRGDACSLVPRRRAPPRAIHRMSGRASCPMRRRARQISPKRVALRLAANRSGRTAGGARAPRRRAKMGRVRMIRAR